MKKNDVISSILGKQRFSSPAHEQGQAFAPTNIALCKYWGKRDSELNLPVTSSLSISLGEKGAHCTLQQSPKEADIFTLNDKSIDPASAFGQRLSHFLQFFRAKLNFFFQVDMQMNIPYAAGLASSACGYASLVLALDNFFDWKLDERSLSILARLGSGSACRSVIPGFVEWEAGSALDGMDSYAQALPVSWPELCVGLHIVDEKEKLTGSRAAMERTAATSMLYSAWPSKVAVDLDLIKQALDEQDFILMGETAESNALNMHALMLSAWPPISYATPATVSAMHQIWKLRQQGLPLYFTQDAGPNLKLLFMERDKEEVLEHFPGIEVLQPQK